MLTEEQIAELERILQAGSDLETACQFVGVAVSVVYRLLEQGKVESERRQNSGDVDPSLDNAVIVWDALKKARASAIVRNVTIVQQSATNGNWNAARWWLENHLPEVYGRKDKPAKGQKELE